MEVNHILKLIADFLSEQNLHKTVACLIDEANLPHYQDNYDKLVDSEDWSQLVKAC